MWSWFVTTKFGRGLLAVGAVLLAVGVSMWYGFEKGKYHEAKTDADRRAQEKIDAARAAQATRQAARDAAAKVRADAAKQAPPDTDKRDDLDNTF